MKRLFGPRRNGVRAHGHRAGETCPGATLPSNPTPRSGRRHHTRQHLPTTDSQDRFQRGEADLVATLGEQNPRHIQAAGFSVRSTGRQHDWPPTAAATSDGRPASPQRPPPPALIGERPAAEARQRAENACQGDCPDRHRGSGPFRNSDASHRQRPAPSWAPETAERLGDLPRSRRRRRSGSPCYAVSERRSMAEKRQSSASHSNVASLK